MLADRGLGGGVLTERQKYEVACLAVLAVVMAAALVAGGHFDFTISTRPVAFLDGSCGPRLWSNGLECQREGEWEVGQTGWTLKPGRSGEVLAKVSLTPESGLTRLLAGGRADRHARLSLSASGVAAPGALVEVSLSADGRSFIPLALRLPLDGHKVALTALADGQDSVWIKLRIAGEGAADGAPPVILSRIHVTATKAPLSIPNLAIAALLVLTPLLAYCLRIEAENKWAMPYALGVLCGLALLVEAITGTWTFSDDPIRWWELTTDGAERDWYLFVPYLVLLALSGARAWGEPLPGKRIVPWGWFALAGIFVWGLSRRIVAFAHVVDQVLESDVVGYREIARAATSPYDTHFREPLWIWMNTGWLTVVGWDAPQVRILSLIMSLIMVAVAYKVFRDYTGRPLIGGLVAVLLFMNPYLIRLSVRGFREEAYAATVLAVVYFALVPTPALSLRVQVVGLALAGAAMQLLRFNSYAMVLPLLLLWAWRKAEGKRILAAIPILFILAVSIPHVLHNDKVYGDPLYSINMHVSWYRNYEFSVAKGAPCEGCPSREEYFVTPYAGPPVTPFQYLFGMHSLGEIAITTLKGYWTIYLTPTEWFAVQTGTRSLAGYALYLLGLGLVLASRYREMVVLIMLLANFLPFLSTYNMEARIAVYTVPFVTFILAYGLVWTFDKILERGTSVGARWASIEDRRPRAWAEDEVAGAR